MPMPSVEPIPPVSPSESRLSVPDDAQDASYLAASARISSFLSKSMEQVFSPVPVAPATRIFNPSHRAYGAADAARPQAVHGNRLRHEPELFDRWQVPVPPPRRRAAADLG